MIVASTLEIGKTESLVTLAEDLAGFDSAAESRNTGCRCLIAAGGGALHDAAEVGIGDDAAGQAHGARGRLTREDFGPNFKKPLRRLGQEDRTVRPARRRIAHAGAEIGAVIVAAVCVSLRRQH